MEINKSDIAQIKEIHDSYTLIREEFSRLEEDMKLVERRKNIISEKLSKLREDEQETIKTRAIIQTAYNYLKMSGICPKCFEVYIVSGYVCSECGYDITAD